MKTHGDCFEVIALDNALRAWRKVLSERYGADHPIFAVSCFRHNRLTYY